VIKSKRMSWTRYVARIREGGERHVQGFSGKIGRKRPLGRPRHRWEENIEMDLKELGCGGTD
jgi:hypothetical protein